MTEVAPLLQPDRGQRATALHLVDRKAFDAWLAARPERVRQAAQAAGPSPVRPGSTARFTGATRTGCCALHRYRRPMRTPSKVSRFGRAGGSGEPQARSRRPDYLRWPPKLPIASIAQPAALPPRKPRTTGPASDPASANSGPSASHAIAPPAPAINPPTAAQGSGCGPGRGPRGWSSGPGGGGGHGHHHFFRHHRGNGHQSGQMPARKATTISMRVSMNRKRAERTSYP